VPLIVSLLLFLVRHHRKARLDLAVLRIDYPR
jgi:hypothetical protein